MIELILCLIVLYGLITIPYKLWVTSGKYYYLKKETDSKIGTLEFNNQYYIDQINSYVNQVKTLAGQKDMYYSFWSDSLNRLLEIEDIVSEMPDGEYKSQLEEILYREEVEE
jgi:ABC-type uncharacterized transport system ATPase subunit